MSWGQQAGDVHQITVLKTQDRSDYALELLKEIHQLVKPLMKKHGWYLPVLCEFLPSQAELHGLNVNRGQKICIRLRPNSDPYSFLDRDTSLIPTMLHELAHNSRIAHGHDKEFYKLLEILTDEYDELRRKKYVAFLGDGNRVGVGRAHNASAAQARQMALAKAEERARTSRLLGAGGKLGGAVPDMKGKRPSDIRAEAAERRRAAEKGCGSGGDHAHGDHLPPAMQREVDLAAKDGRTVIIDLTGDSSDEDDDEGDELEIVPSGSGLKPVKKEPHDVESSDSDITVVALSNSRGSASSRSTKGATSKATSKSTNGKAPVKSPIVPAKPPTSQVGRPTPPSRPSSSSSISQSSSTSSKKRPGPPPPRKAAGPAWTCPACTFDNTSKVALECEMCGSERPESVTVALAASAPPPPKRARGATVELEEGWACVCGNINSHTFWSCLLCRAIKTSSSHG